MWRVVRMRQNKSRKFHHEEASSSTCIHVDVRIGVCTGWVEPIPAVPKWVRECAPTSEQPAARGWKYEYRQRQQPERWRFSVHDRRFPGRDSISCSGCSCGKSADGKYRAGAGLALAPVRWFQTPGVEAIGQGCHPLPLRHCRSFHMTATLLLSRWQPRPNGTRCRWQ